MLEFNALGWHFIWWFPSLYILDYVVPPLLKNPGSALDFPPPLKLTLTPPPPTTDELEFEKLRCQVAYMVPEVRLKL